MENGEEICYACVGMKSDNPHAPVKKFNFHAIALIGPCTLIKGKNEAYFSAGAL